MILTFKEIGINAADLNGISAVFARAIVINRACDYIMWWHLSHLPESMAIPNPNSALVDFVNHVIDIDTALPSIH